MMDADPRSLTQVEEEIYRLSNRLGQITAEVAEAAEAEARAEVAYKRKAARTWLELRSHKGTVPEKEAEVLDRCGDEFEAMKVAEAIYRACQESGRNVRSQLDALRTVAANARAGTTYATGRGG